MWHAHSTLASLDGVGLAFSLELERVEIWVLGLEVGNGLYIHFPFEDFCIRLCGLFFMLRTIVPVYWIKIF